MAKISPKLQALIDSNDVMLFTSEGDVAKLPRRKAVNWNVRQPDRSYVVVRATIERMNRRAEAGHSFVASEMAKVAREQKIYARPAVPTVAKLPKAKPSITKKTEPAAIPTTSSAWQHSGYVHLKPSAVDAPPQPSKLLDPTVARVIFVVDRSPSMFFQADGAVPRNHYYMECHELRALPIARRRHHIVNEQVAALLATLKQESPHFLVDFINFDQRAQDVYIGKLATAAECPPQPDLSGGTSIYVALQYAVDRALSYIAKNPVLIYMLTDGENNGPVVYSLGDKVKLLLGSGRATIAAIGPKAALSFLRDLNVPDGCIRDWSGSDAADLKKATEQASQGVKQYSEAVKRGKTAVSTIFVDVVAAGTTVERVRKELRDVTSSLRVRKVTKFTSLKDFVEKELKLSVIPGAGYYPLQKVETLKDGRRVIVQPRGTEAFYAGPAARKLLGLPETGDCKVEPKNLGDLVVYFQSASPTRKLLPGTWFLYDESHVAGATAPTFEYGKGKAE